MPVAKSYAQYPIVSEVYMQNGRKYVDIRVNSRTRTVRWYSDSEYARMYGEEIMKRTKSQKEVLGFSEGYITVFYGDTFPYKGWFKEQGARYHGKFGWYVCGGQDVPEDLPAVVKSARLDWDSVGFEDGNLKNDDIIKEVMDNIIYEPDDSEYVGEIGDKVTITVTVERAITLNGYYGVSTMHIMRGEDGNVYTWNTASKSWEEGEVKTIKGTIKDHSVYRNTKQTVLTRCREVNK